MSALNFDPYALIAKSPEGDAKHANVAKPAPTLASLATLAPRHAKSENVRWNKSDWQAFFNERAAIAEYDGGLSRVDAERRAYEHCVVRWLNTHPQAGTRPETCPHCQKPTDQTSLAVLNSGGGHLWIHNKCHAPWLACRRLDAETALARFMIHAHPEIVDELEAQMISLRTANEQQN